jgi:hypothetical protein
MGFSFSRIPQNAADVDELKEESIMNFFCVYLRDQREIER